MVEDATAQRKPPEVGRVPEGVSQVLIYTLINRVYRDLWYNAPPMKGGTPYGRFTVRRSVVPSDGVSGFHEPDPRGVSELVAPFEVAFQAQMTQRRVDGKPRTACQFSVYKNCPLPTSEDRLLFRL
jgi:hypothetical protein